MMRADRVHGLPDRHPSSRSKRFREALHERLGWRAALNSAVSTLLAHDCTRTHRRTHTGTLKLDWGYTMQYNDWVNIYVLVVTQTEARVINQSDAPTLRLLTAYWHLKA